MRAIAACLQLLICICAPAGSLHGSRGGVIAGGGGHEGCPPEELSSARCGMPLPARLQTPPAVVPSIHTVANIFVHQCLFLWLQHLQAMKERMRGLASSLGLPGQ
jgi:hypothetical protein